MKKFHSVLPWFKLGFDFICIVLTGIYTFQQLDTYIKNEDYSDISFRKFADDSSSEYYPTYTICFEDQSQYHIYKTEHILTGSFSDSFKSERCPCGCHVQKERNKLLLVNNTCPDPDENPELFTIHSSYNTILSMYDEHGNLHSSFLDQTSRPDFASAEEYFEYQYHDASTNSEVALYDSEFPFYDQGVPFDNHTHYTLNAAVFNFTVDHDVFLPNDSNYSNSQDGSGHELDDGFEDNGLKTAASMVCNGGDICCTPDNKCGGGEGDCDRDNDCQEGLKCGTDNCANKEYGNPTPYPNQEWDATDDCCYKATNGHCNKHFEDRDGYSCQDYKLFKWCTSSGEYGDGWPEYGGSFDDYSRNDESATVCPQCGCEDDTDFSSNDTNVWERNFWKEYWEEYNDENETVLADIDLTEKLPILPEDMIIINVGNKSYVISPEQYKLLLLGFNQTFKFRYDNATNYKITESIDLDFSDVDFNETTINLEDILLDFEVRTENASKFGWISDDYKTIQTYCSADNATGLALMIDCTSQRVHEKYFKSRINPSYPPFKKQYQDPEKVCYTPSLHPSVYRKTDRITLDLLKMIDSLYDHSWDESNELPFMKIYIHMQGQFMRGIDKEIAGFTKRDISTHCLDRLMFPTDEGVTWPSLLKKCFGTKLVFDISQVTLLRSRHDSIRPCNPKMKDEDAEIWKTLMNDKNLECFPTYWKEFKPNSEINECNNTVQYRFISNMTTNFTKLSNIIENAKQKFESPCDEMIIITNKQEKKGREMLRADLSGQYDHRVYENEVSLRLDIEFNQVNPVYQIIKNGRSFSVESCWAGIGGFVGIFVGVSLRQIPDLMIDFFKLIHKKLF